MRACIHLLTQALRQAALNGNLSMLTSAIGGALALDRAAQEEALAAAEERLAVWGPPTESSACGGEGTSLTVLNEAGSDGQTAMHICAQFGHVELASALLKAGAGASVSNQITGRMPFHAAAINGDCALAKLLLDANANPNARDTRGRTVRTCQYSITCWMGYTYLGTAVYSSWVRPCSVNVPCVCDLRCCDLHCTGLHWSALV